MITKNEVMVNLGNMDISEYDGQYPILKIENGVLKEVNLYDVKISSIRNKAHNNVLNIDTLVRLIFDVLPVYYDEKEAKQVKKLILEYIR